MTAVRHEGRLNPNTTLIDAELFGLKGIVACFLVESGDQKILIDAGAKSSGAVIYKKLKDLDAWPVNKIILTHSHFDHSQGVIFLREKAEEEGFNIEVMASEKGIPFLKNQKYNTFFDIADQKPFKNITDIKPLRDGDVIELSDEFHLKIIETPGHMVDDICIYDEQNKCVIVGDCIGAKQVDSFLICNANSPYWDEKAYHSTIEKLRTLNFETLCISHFGYFTGDEATSFLDESVEIFGKWKGIFEENSDKLDDIPFLESQLWEKVYSHKPKSFRDTVGIAMQNFVKLAVIGYRSSKKSN